MLPNFFHPDILEAGCDEAGRGCLAGPVYAAAVILPPDFHHPLLNDSKLMSEAARDTLRPIIEAEAVAWAVGVCSPREIDQYNIANASYRAMHKAVDQLTDRPAHLLIDGHRFIPYFGVPHTCMIKGDSRFAHIAAASVLAKTYRDEYMRGLAEQHPEYGWLTNKGYPTKAHRAAIGAHGVTKYHRQSFRLKY